MSTPQYAKVSGFVMGLFTLALGALFLFIAHRCATDPGVQYAFIKGSVFLASAGVLLFCGGKAVTDLRSR
jgi:vacuolar-type H+-ATPase subunit I/STV1